MAAARAQVVVVSFVEFRTFKKPQYMFTQRVDRLNAAIKEALSRAGAEHPFRLSLVLASFASSAASEVQPLVLPLLDVSFPQLVLDRFASPPRESARHLAESQEGFLPWPKHVHTFAVEPWRTMPPRIVSFVVAVSVFVGPWVLFAGMVCTKFDSTDTVARHGCEGAKTERCIGLTHPVYPGA